MPVSSALLRWHSLNSWGAGQEQRGRKTHGVRGQASGQAGTAALLLLHLPLLQLLLAPVAHSKVMRYVWPVLLACLAGRRLQRRPGTARPFAWVHGACTPHPSPCKPASAAPLTFSRRCLAVAMAV